MRTRKETKVRILMVDSTIFDIEMIAFVFGLGKAKYKDDVLLFITVNYITNVIKVYFD